jgi:hypothetical protein
MSIFNSVCSENSILTGPDTVFALFEDLRREKPAAIIPDMRCSKWIRNKIF